MAVSPSSSSSTTSQLATSETPLDENKHQPTPLGLSTADAEMIAINWMQRFEQATGSSASCGKVDDSTDAPSSNDGPTMNMIATSTQQLFTSQSTPYWRDMVALTWNIVTMQGHDAIASALHDCATVTGDWQLQSHDDVETVPSPSHSSLTLKPAHWMVVTDNVKIEFWATFATLAGRGRAHVRLVREENDGTDNAQERDAFAAEATATAAATAVWKATTVLTTLQSLHNRPWRVAPYHRPRGSQHGPILNRSYFHKTTAARRLHDGIAEPAIVDNENSGANTYVLIIGGGQGGLSLAARLQALDIPYLVVEAGTAPGSSWRHRYPSLVLHDPVYYNHMPYLPFPPTWPVFCPRDKIAAWMAHYAIALDLNVQCQTKVMSARQDRDDTDDDNNDDDNNNDGLWTVQLESSAPLPQQQNNQVNVPISDTNNGNQNPIGTTIRRTLRCRHLVFATGNSSHPRLPAISGQFSGLKLHSSQYKGGKAYVPSKLGNKRVLKHAVVIGSNNSAFDICQDLWEQLSVAAQDGTLESITMIQRTPAMVVSTDSVLRFGLGPLYREQADMPHEEADLVATTVPYQLTMNKWKQVTALMADNDAKLLQGMARAGYRLDNGPDGTGIFAKSATEGGGFYINVGCADLIIRGDVAVRYATVERFDGEFVVVNHIDDNVEERLPADLVIFATGFDTMDEWVRDICGSNVANAVGRTWGLGLGHKAKDPGPWQGELRNMWKPTAVDGLWFQGGNLAQNRHYSRYLALQLAARYMGLDTKVHGIPKPTPPASSI